MIDNPKEQAQPPAARGEEPARRRQNLGRGLMALLGDEAGETRDLDPTRQARTIPIELVKPSHYQPRLKFDDEQFESLVESVKQKGILQPILVRRHPETASMFEIVAGERRWRAAQQAQLHEVPAIVRELTDREALEVALVENLQRQDLNALEEAIAYRKLMEEYNHTQEGLAQAIGKSRSHIANTLRLLGLPERVKNMLLSDMLSAGHARALLNARDPDGLAALVVNKGYSVRQTERLAQETKAARAGKRSKREKDANTLAIERDLANLLGLRVTVNFRGNGGELVIHYSTLEQLDGVLQRLRQEAPRPPAG